jgi:cell division protein FtsI/penicillin-binding protein 2
MVDMQEVLNQSLNTGAAHVAEQLGRDKMRTYFRDWFEDQTGVDLPGEVDNEISNLDVERDLEFATASFGQGIALTPIATVRALSTLANGGHLIRPHVTKSIDYQLGGTSKIETGKGERVVSEEAAETVSRMLATVVDEAMSDYARDRHSIAAKTGTAQIPKPGGGYYEDTFNHTFFGYFPAYEPEYLVFLMARQPKDVKYASQTLKKPFMRMADFLINYYNIPPDR